ncbi:hypothetical protein D8W71_12330 [Rhodococcus sp. P1Y]|nr:hypothetical protein D8W71_12330 [Rhodococcus sp. P1Y]
MTRTDQLLLRVRSHVHGETLESLERAGFTPWEVERQIGYGHLRAGENGRITYVYNDEDAS